MLLKKICSASVLELLSLLIPILILPILSAKASTHELADYLVIVLVVLTCQQIVDYSYTYLSSRMSADEIVEEFSVIFSSKIILALIAALIFFPILIHYIDSKGTILVIAILLGFLSNLFSSQWLYVSAGEYSVFQVYNFFSKSTIFLSIIGFPHFYDFGYFMFFYYLAVLMVNVVVFMHKCRRLNIKKMNFEFRSGINSIKVNYHLFVADFIPQLYVTLPLILFKGIWDSVDYVALSVAHRFYNAGMTVQWASLKTIIPASKNFSSSNVTRIFLFTACFSVLKIAAVFFIAGSLIDLMFSYNSDEILFYLKILSIGFLGAAFYISYGYGYAILTKTESEFKRYSFYLTLPAAITVWYSSYYFGAIGFALGLVFARLMNGIFFYVNYKKKVFLQ